MDKNEEYKWISRTFKGEFWDKAKRSLAEDYGFTEIEGQHFKSTETDAVYKFEFLEYDDKLIVTRIEELIDNKYIPIDFSVSDRLNTIAKHRNSECKEKDSFSQLKDDILGNIYYTAPTGFASLLNELSKVSYPIIKFKKYLGMKEDSEFHSFHFLDLEFEEEGGNVYCKLVRRKPNGVHRVINTPNGIYYAEPINLTFSDLIDCIDSKIKLLNLIGFDGILDIYKDPNWSDK